MSIIIADRATFCDICVPQQDILAMSRVEVNRKTNAYSPLISRVLRLRKILYRWPVCVAMVEIVRFSQMLIFYFDLKSCLIGI